ncbi:MAG: DUF3830 family protein [Thermomicrobiales bacterium]
MARWIDVAVDDTHARFALQDDLAPQTAAALWDALPLSASLRHSTRCGEACSAEFSTPALAALPERPEVFAASIYKGWLAVRSSPPQTLGEIVISYGLAEYRTATGRQQITPLAELVGDGEALFAALQRTHTEGEKTLHIRPAASQ